VTKKRKVYYQVEKALKTPHNIIILMGMRKVGKTTTLQQLAKDHKGFYVNFKEEKDTQDAFVKAITSSYDLILFDEIGYLDSHDQLLEGLQREKKKFVITSSSYPALRQLASEGLGGGRSCVLQMFPLDFEEYLYFSGKIRNYNEDYNPTEEDVGKFYRLKDVPQGMDMVIDEEYIATTFEDIQVATENKQFAERGIFLDAKSHNAILDILAYTLNRQFRLKVFGDTNVGVQEFSKPVASSLDLSDSLIAFSNEKAGEYSPESLALILAYLATNAFVFVDLKMTGVSVQKIDDVVSSLLAVKLERDLRSLLKEYTFSVTSLPLYTRLMVDLEVIADKLSDHDPFKGQLYELAVKTTFLKKGSYNMPIYSYKYSEVGTDKGVDLYVSGKWDRPPLLLEATVSYKGDSKHNVTKFLKEREVIRVVTDLPGVWEEEKGYYRIGYPKALLMLSNKTIFNLRPSKLE